MGHGGRTVMYATGDAAWLHSELCRPAGVLAALDLKNSWDRFLVALRS
jgi:hypothetical protein